MEEHGINSATLIVHSVKSRDSITWSQDSTVVVKNRKVNQRKQSDALKKKLGFWTVLKVIKILPGFCAFAKSLKRS